MNRSVSAALAAAVLSPFAVSQTVLGHYDQTDVTGPITTAKIYVDSLAPAGGDGSVCAPFNDVAMAVAAVNPAVATSINVAGTHTLAITIPAHGVTIEGYTTPSSPNRPRFNALPTGQPMIVVDTEGDPDLPASVIQGIDFRDFPTGGPTDVAIVISPGALTATAAVEVTRCSFENMQIGILVAVAPGTETTRHVVHDNTFTWPFEQEFPSTGTTAIEVVADGPSSTLVRANEISNYETAFSCITSSQSQPRLQSNAIQRATTGVLLIGADADLRSNSIAFGTPRGAAAQVAGINVNGGTLQLYNSIVWNPTTAIPTVDVVAAAGASIVTPGVNLFFNVPAGFPASFPAGTQPDFVGGNTVFGVYPPVSLDLQSGSAMVDAGVNADTADVTLASPALLGSLQLSRVDVGLDIDQGPRIYNGTTDVGCDELMEFVDPLGTGSYPISITPAAWSGSGPYWDGDGNLLGDASQQWSITFDVQGPPNSVFVVPFEGWVYAETLSLPTGPMTSVAVANDDIFQHSLSPFGNIFWDLTSGFHVQQATPGFTDAAGNGSVTITYNGLGMNNLESCVTVQMTFLDAQLGLHQSNKFRIEINEACPTP